MRRFAVIFICLLVTILSLRYLLNSTFFPVHDYTHVARLVELDRAIKDGHIPVRWVRDLGFGYGEALFSFYGPMPYYIAEVFHLLGFPALISIKALLIFMTIFGFAGMYLLASKLFGRTGGVLAASAFLLIPYRAVDLFVRGAFNELFAISVIPWIMYAILKIKEKSPKGDSTARMEKYSLVWTGAAAFFFLLLFTSHNLMTMMFLPFLYIFGLIVMINGKNRVQNLFKLHLALLLGVAAAAFYLFPSFLEKGFTQVDKLIGGYGMYEYHFLYIRQFFFGNWSYGGSIAGPEDGLSFHLGLAHVLLAGVGIAAWLYLKKKKASRVVALFAALGTGLALFLTLYKSQFIWDRIPIFVYFQFPWRYLSVTTVFIPLMCGGAVLWIKNAKQQKIAALIAIIILLAVNLRYFAPSGLMKDPNALYYEDPLRIQESMSQTLPDYIPIGMKVIQPPFLPQFELSTADDSKQIQVLADRTQEKLLSISLQRPSQLTIRTAWFPNWTVYDQGKKVSFTVDENTDFMIVPLSAGNHLISVKFEDTMVRTASNILSIFGLLGIAGALLYDRYSRS